MFNSKKKYLPLMFIILLSCIFLTQSWLILRRINNVRKVPVFIPLLVPGENYSSFDLEKAGIQVSRLLENVGRIGPTISLEDMVRGILLLEKKGELSLNPRQKSKILAILMDAYKKREELLKCQGEILRLQREIPILGAGIYGYLTPEQKDYITINRDRISLKEFEESTWENLSSSLEKIIE